MNLIVLRAGVKILEGVSEVLQEARRKDVLVHTKLMTRLAYDGVHHVQAGNFQLGFTLSQIKRKTKK